MQIANGPCPKFSLPSTVDQLRCVESCGISHLFCHDEATTKIPRGIRDVTSVDLPWSTWLAQFMRLSLSLAADNYFTLGLWSWTL